MGRRPKGRLSTVCGCGTRATQTRSEAPRVNAVHVPIYISALVANLITSHSRVGITGLNDEQMHTLVKLLNEHNKHPSLTTQYVTSFSSSWIVESGETNHMTYSLGSLPDVRDIPPLPSKLPKTRFIYEKSKELWL